VSASERFAQLGLELHCSNRKLVVRDYASHASGMTLDRAGTQAELRLDGDDLIRLRELCTAVHVETVDHVVIAVDEQYLVGGLFSDGADPTAVGVTDRLSVEILGADVAARVGSHERDEQMHDPVSGRQLVGTVPHFQCHAQIRPLGVVEPDRFAHPDRLEPRDDRTRSGDASKLLDQPLALVPGDRDDFSRYVDVRTVEALRHGAESTARARSVVRSPPHRRTGAPPSRHLGYQA
jgi:hypothetical protein